MTKGTPVSEVDTIAQIRALEHEMFNEDEQISVRVCIGDSPEEVVDVDPTANVVQTLRRELGIKGTSQIIFGGTPISSGTFEDNSVSHGAQLSVIVPELLTTGWDGTLKVAVRKWLQGGAPRDEVEAQYGPMSDWNAPQVTFRDMGSNTGPMGSKEFLTDQQVATLLKGIVQCAMLETLDLTRTDITSLPVGIKNCTALQTLNLEWCNELQSLPEAIGGCTALHTLNLCRCEKLQSLPEGTGQLSNLKELNLHECWELQSLPESESCVTASDLLSV